MVAPFPQPFGALQELRADYGKGFFFLALRRAAISGLQRSGGLTTYIQRNDGTQKRGSWEGKGNAKEQTLLEPATLRHGSSCGVDNAPKCHCMMNYTCDAREEKLPSVGWK